MEVHPPHGALNSWRDFFIHIATITIGLLIAIGLEQSVEFLHHRHIVHEARENIRREIQQNRTEATTNLKYIQTNEDNMKANVDKARSLRDHPGLPTDMRFTFSWDSFNESAWLSARDSGALTYMPVAEVQRYADVYGQQEIVNRGAVDTFTHQSELAAPLMLEADKDPVRPEQAVKVAEGCAETYMRLETLHELIEELDHLYANTLKSD